jgi:predicted TIM-barrel fold metal-dependent hydrolase
MRRRNDPEGLRLPIKLDSATNGEFLPLPLPPHVALANRTALERATEHARRLRVGRRDFLVSLSGAATCLLVMNEVNAALGRTGGRFLLPAEAALDAGAAEAALGKREFIFDIQTHHFDPPAAWTAATPWSETIRETAETTDCNVLPNEKFGYMSCSDARTFVREIFMDSDTDAAVLSFVPTAEQAMPLSYREASATRQIVDALEGRRLLLHGRIIPNLPGDLERMSEVLETWKIAAWKTYTQYGPDHSGGWWLDDEQTGRPFLEKVRASGVRTVCCHKGLPLPFPLMGTKNVAYKSCRDVGPAAKAYPDIAFIIYHSGFDPDLEEGAFVPGKPVSGTDSLVQSLLDAGIGPGSNVYAELGATWHTVMRDPDQAAHLLGKLLKYVGEDNVVWGTDCIFFGSPQDQIQAFRAFEISAAFQERHGYPALTDAIRAKVFGLNALRAYGLDPKEFARATAGDAITQARRLYAGNVDPTFRSYGPRTRREFLTLARVERT